MSDQHRRLDITADTLPTGRVSIEASAGTGKTYSLSVLAARFVAETGLAPEHLLLVTYTNEATRELRTRTRERCQEALRLLRTGGEVHDWMTTMAAPAMRELAAARLEDFLARFDEATVTTIHGFCQAVLRRAGASSPAPDDPRVEANVWTLVDQVITDTLVGHLATDQSWLCGPGEVTAKRVRAALDALRRSVKAVLGNPGADVWPPPARGGDSHLRGALDTSALGRRDPPPDATERATALAVLVRRLVAEVHRRNDESGVLTYDDMIRFVAGSLEQATDGSSGGAPTRLALDLASQYRVIMVDEFQDTDALQWQIFKSIHDAGGPSSTLITVGDPKQAIYRFRGADVGVYLAATVEADERYSLGINWRSDKPLLEALERLFDGVVFDAEGLAAFVPVDHAPGRDDSALGARPGAPPTVPGAPLEIRVIGDHSELGSGTNAKGTATRNASDAVLELFLADATASIVELLAHATLDVGAPGDPPRALTPGDVAVLVNSHDDAEAMVVHLRDAGVPAVRLKTGSVFASEAARQWQMLLAAVAHPGRIVTVRTFGLSWFADTDEADLLANSEAVAGLQRRCAELGEMLAREGIVAFYLTLRNDPAFLARVLAGADGERNITDLDHIAEMLGADPRLRKAGPAEFEAVFNRMLEESDAEADEQKRRIETDRTAVTVMTHHASKGLQFPVVFLPTLAKGPARSSKPLMFPPPSGPNGPARRVVDVGSAFDHASQWAFDVGEAEQLASVATSKQREEASKADIDHDLRRRLYVAMTRAQHKLVLYWSAISNNGQQPLPRLLRHAVDAKKLPTDDAALAAVLAPLTADTDGSIAVRVLSPVVAPSRHEPTAGPAESAPVAVAGFSRADDDIVAPGFGRWSYSGITRRADGEKRPHTAATVLVTGDDQTDDQAADQTRADFAWHGIPAGARFGDAVHKILDSIDPGTATVTEVAEHAARAFSGWRDPLDRDRLANLLHSCLSHPLGGLLRGHSLRTLGSTNRLSELRFDFRLPQRSAFSLEDFTAAALAGADEDFPAVLEANLREMTGAGRGALTFSGHMTGSIDALFRVPGDVPAFVVSDYKTNLVHTDADTDPRTAYTCDRLENEMARHGYFVQSLIYTVALHRYLRWRLADYDYDRHVGGVSYLFLRGLTADTYLHGDEQRPYGVYEWRPPRASVESLDRLFTGSAP